MAVTTWLIDESAYTRLPDSPDAQSWVERIERGMVRISTVTRLEIGLREFEEYRDRLMSSLVFATSDDLEADLYGD